MFLVAYPKIKYKYHVFPIFESAILSKHNFCLNNRIHVGRKDILTNYVRNLKKNTKTLDITKLHIFFLHTNISSMYKDIITAARYTQTHKLNSPLFELVSSAA